MGGKLSFWSARPSTAPRSCQGYVVGFRERSDNEVGSAQGTWLQYRASCHSKPKQKTGARFCKKGPSEREPLYIGHAAHTPEVGNLLDPISPAFAKIPLVTPQNTHTHSSRSKSLPGWIALEWNNYVKVGTPYTRFWGRIYSPSHLTRYGSSWRSAPFCSPIEGESDETPRARTDVELSGVSWIGALIPQAVE